jgi:hypothetical protein
VDNVNQSKLEDIFHRWQVQGYLKKGSSLEDLNLTPLGFLMCDSLIDDIFKEITF